MNVSLAVLEAIPGRYLSDPYKVRLVDGEWQNGGYFANCCFWDGSGWVIEIGRQYGNRLQMLLHELGHIVLGHTRKVALDDESAKTRISDTYTAVYKELAGRTDISPPENEVERRVREILLERERAANAWALWQESLLLPELERARQGMTRNGPK